MDHQERSEPTGSLRAPMVGLLFFKLLINTTQRAIYPFLPVIARGMGVSLPAAGAMVSVRWGAGMATPFLVGTVGRRRPPSTLLVMGSAIFTVGALVTALTGVFAGALIGFALLGIAKPTFDIGSTSWVAERVPFQRRARYLGVLEVSWAGGLLLGAPLFGVLIDRFDWTTPFLVIGLVTAAGTAVLWRLGRSVESVTVTESDSVAAPFDRPAIAFLVVGGLISFSIELILVVLGEWLEVGFGLTLLALGGVGTLLGAAELVGEGGVLVITDRIGSRRALQLATVGMAIGFGILAATGDSLVFGMAALTFAILAFEFGIVSALPLATEIRPTDRARFLSIYLVAHSAARVVADLTAPTLFDRAGIGPLAVIASASSLLALFTVTRWVRVPAGPR